MRTPPVRQVAILGTVCISVSAVLVLLAAVTPITSAFYRAAYALPVLVVISWFLRGQDPRSSRMRLGAVVSGALLAADLFFFHSAIDAIGAGLATVAAHTQVIFVGVFSWVLYRQMPTRRTFLFGAVIFAGVTLISGLGRDSAFGDEPVRGVIYGVISGSLYAAFMLGLQASNPGGRGPAVRVLADTTVGTMLGAAAIGGLTGTLELAPSWPSHGWLIALALLVQVIGWALLTYSLPRLPAITVSLIILGQPMLAVLWGWLLLDESLSPIQVAGVVLVLVGLVAVNAQRTLVEETVSVSVPS
jgi:drug/metabolite transporter (DMT)-like permease